MNKLKYIL